MMQSIDFEEDNIVGFRMQGKITEDEIKAWANRLDQKTHRTDKLRVYVEAEDIDDVSVNAVLEDLKFDLTHLGDFVKAAFVSDETWTKLSTVAAKLIPGIEAKQFSAADKASARQWITS